MTNRTAFITGASRGIGRACALALSEAGARVALAARNMAQLEELAGEIRSKGREAFPVTIDMTSADSINEAFAKTAKEFGPVAILVNNAGITKDGLALRMKQEDWDSVLVDESDRIVSRHPASAARHDARALGPHHQYFLGGWRNGQSRAKPIMSRRKLASSV